MTCVAFKKIDDKNHTFYLMEGVFSKKDTGQEMSKKPSSDFFELCEVTRNHSSSTNKFTFFSVLCVLAQSGYIFLPFTRKKAECWHYPRHIFLLLLWDASNGETWSFLLSVVLLYLFVVKNGRSLVLWKGVFLARKF